MLVVILTAELKKLDTPEYKGCSECSWSCRLLDSLNANPKMLSHKPCFMSIF